MRGRKRTRSYPAPKRRGAIRKKGRRPRRQRRNTRVMLNPVGLNGLPRKFVAKHKYVTEVQLNPGIDSYAYHDFVLNGLYDPDYTGTGHQPRGFDQMMAFFNHYCVIGAKMFVQYRPDTTSVNPGPPAYWGITKCAAVNELSSYSNVIDIIEGKNSRLNRTGTGTIYPTGQFYRTSMGYSPKKWFGISKPLTNDKIQGYNGANPTDYAVATLWAGSINKTDPGSSNFIVTIYFTAVYTEPKFLAAS